MPRCRVKNCSVKNANFNLLNETSGICCAKHKDENMINILSKKCLLCDKQPFFNLPAENIGIYCNQHKLENMINILSKKCLLCDKQPSFNLPSEKTGIYCVEHKLENMVDVKNKRCLLCDKRPHFNLPAEKTAIYCVEHKLENMIDVKSKRCLFCEKIPNYNLPNEKTGIYCVEHKLENMIDVKNKRCLFCEKIPNYNLPNEKTGIYCVEHKLENMIDVKSKRCLFCDKYPYYNLPEENTGIYCVKHKLENMIDVHSKRCKNGCNTIVNSTTTSKYKGYCLRCFIYTFPDEPVAKNYKVKEKHVKDFIDSEFKDYKFIYDKKIVDGCSLRRPDFYLDCYTHVIVVECDENSHNGYSCENKRMMQLFIDSGSIPFVIIRFNPDKYIDINNKKIDSCFVYHKKTNVPIIKNKLLWQQRLDTLKDKIQYYIDNIPTKEITIEQLYYDVK